MPSEAKRKISPFWYSIIWGNSEGNRKLIKTGGKITAGQFHFGPKNFPKISPKIFQGGQFAPSAPQ
jgi:hypothetical protein